MLKIQLLSDLHLEFHDNPVPEIEDNIELLILAGDIGYHHEKRYQEFLKKCNDTVQNTILITGNHEYYYSQGYGKVDKKIQELVDTLPNVHFLQKTYFDLDNRIRILGCTLWTYIPNEYSSLIEGYMNDYQKIRTKKEINGKWKKYKINTEQVNIWYNDYQKWLEQAINQAENEGKRVIVVTHHSPVLNEEMEKNWLNFGYYSNQSKLLESGKILLWCYGHTHRANMENIGKTLVWCNPRGYPREKTKYESNGAIYLDENYELFF